MTKPTTTTGTATTATRTPSTAQAASCYQQLRAHLNTLKLHAAAEALPTILWMTLQHSNSY